jgi:beta-galactosidase beta subunit
MNKALVITIASAAALASACGETQKPTDQLVATQVAMRTADDARGKEVPQAQLHRKYAEEQLQGAQHLMAEGDNEGAASMLERAKADAEYATAVSRKAEVSREVASLEDAVNDANDIYAP